MEDNYILTDVSCDDKGRKVGDMVTIHESPFGTISTRINRIERDSFGKYHYTSNGYCFGADNIVKKAPK